MSQDMCVLITEINHCASEPCENGGTCTNHMTGVTCECHPDYIGAMCDNGELCLKKCTISLICFIYLFIA